MPVANHCPEQFDYQRLIHGELEPSDVDRLSQHLSGCSSCAAAVHTLLGEDTLLSGIGGAPDDAPNCAPIPTDLTQRLLALRLSTDTSCDPSHTLQPLNPPHSPDEIGRLAHYRVLKVLGERGMGVVYLAEDMLLRRTVALKTMKPGIATDPRHRQRFLREARAAAKVEHDHIVPIFGVGEDGGVPWLAMPFLKGQSLDELLKRSKVLKPAQAVRIGAQVAKGLAAAHAAGLIHRDIKPGNIWVEPEGGGRARLLDFGLARDDCANWDGGEHLTRLGAVVGTPAFMAPEQARGEPLDARADLFSLGCVLYRAVTGSLPFRGQGPMGTLLALTTETPLAPHELNPAVPPPLSALIMTLLDKDRSRRPASASAVASALETLQAKTTEPVQMALAAEPRRPESNPWADLTEAGNPTDAGERPAPVAALRHRWRTAAAVALLLALGGTLAAGIIVIIKDKTGKEVGRATVPDGGSAEIKQDGDSEKRKVDPPKSQPARHAAEWVLSISGWIKIRQDGPEREIKAAKDLPAVPFEVFAIYLSNSQKVDDAGLANLKGLTNLEYLDLYATRVSDAGLERLAGLKSLTGLQLGGTQVTDAGMLHLKELVNLTALDLSGTRVTDAGLGKAKGLTKLALLGLAYTKVSDAGLEHVKGLTNLDTLMLTNAPVSDAGLLHLKGLTKLRILDLSGTRVSDAGLAHLKGLSDLTKLALMNTQVTDAGLEHLAELKNLTQLDLANTKVTADGVAGLQKALPKCKIVTGPAAK